LFPGGKKPGKKATRSVIDDIHYLVSHGHDLEAIGDYDLDRFDAFVSAAMRLDAAKRLEYIDDTTVAVGRLFDSKGEASKELLSALSTMAGFEDG
jgi:hypothetical protein